MSCKRFQRDIISKVYGELTGRRLKRLEKHLRTCDDCRRELQELERMREITWSARSEEALDTSYIDAQLKQIAAAEAAARETSAAPKPFYLKPVPAAFAAGILIAVVSAVFISRHGPATDLYRQAALKTKTAPASSKPAADTDNLEVLGYIAGQAEEKSAAQTDSDKGYAGAGSNTIILHRLPAKKEKSRGNNVPAHTARKKTISQPELPAPAPMEGAFKSFEEKRSPFLMEGENEEQAETWDQAYDAFGRTGIDEAQRQGPYDAGGDVSPPEVIRRVEPAYPPAARKEKLEGTVVIEAIIDRTGRLTSARITSSTSRIFEKPALDAVKKWTFKPGTLNGKPVDVRFRITIDFKLK